MNRPMYDARDWILCSCTKCGRLNYVEQHGTTGPCACSPTWVEHASIPHQYRRGLMGMRYFGPKRLPKEIR